MSSTSTAVIAMCNHKGGTGKTTSALNIGAAAGLSGFKVLLVDLDPQGFLSRMVGLEEPHPRDSSMALFSTSFRKGDVTPASFNGFNVMPASRHLTKRMRKLNQPTDHLWIKESLREFGREYDLIVLDTAAAVTVYSLGALVAASLALIPVTPEYQPVRGAESAGRSAQIVREALNPDLPEPRFLLTQADARKRTHHQYRRYLRKKFGSQVLSSIIRTNAALSRAYESGKTVFECEPRSRGARDYANATDEIIQILGMSPPAS